MQKNIFHFKCYKQVVYIHLKGPDNATAVNSAKWQLNSPDLYHITCWELSQTLAGQNIWRTVSVHGTVTSNRKYSCTSLNPVPQRWAERRAPTKREYSSTLIPNYISSKNLRCILRMFYTIELNLIQIHPAVYF